MDTIRLGYVGCGFMAQKVHLPNFSSLPGCKVVALAEVREDLGRRVPAVSKLQEAIGFHPDPPIEQIIQNVIDSVRQSGNT